MHKRFRNPQKGYYRPKSKLAMAQMVDEVLDGTATTAPQHDRMSELMAAPEHEATPQSTIPETREPERMTVTRVIRGSSRDDTPREPSAAQRRLDRLLAMLRRSR